MSNEILSSSQHNDGADIVIKEINGKLFKKLFESSLIWLKTNQQTVNFLNVYPVPDGDTGTNMLLTMQSAYAEIEKIGEYNIGKVAGALSQGALMGARGNSGVILSQIWRGFSRALDNYETMNTKLFLEALKEARDTAYKGVVRPVEGTILTVAKDIALAAEKYARSSNNIYGMLEHLVFAADESVKNTPELLPILKKAGVVDSGGKGLFFIFEGMLRYLQNQSLDTPIMTVQPLSMMDIEDSMEELEPGQDFEVVIDFHPYETIDLEDFYKELSEIGTSIQVGEGDGMYRMHIHVPKEKRNDPIEYIDKLGTLTKVTMENLIEQMESQEREKKSKIDLMPVEQGQIAVVAVSPGPGISRIFASLGVAAIIEGGQTMNPSAEEIVNSFENLPTDKVIILPNNKNIVLAAKSVKDITVKQIEVIPTISIPQGLSAMLRHLPDGDFESVVEDMNEAMQEVDTIEITQATRSVEINEINVKDGEVIGLYNGKLDFSSNDINETCIGILKKIDLGEKERITLFYGNNIDKSDVDTIVENIRSEFTDFEIELHEGGQPHYQFIIALE